MSPEARRPAERRRERAREDVKAANRTVHLLIHDYAGGGWSEARGVSWSPAETVLHLVVTAEQALDRLRVVAAAAAPGGPATFRRTFAQGAAWQLVRSTWRMPRGLRPLQPMPAVGIAIDGETASRRSAAASAHWLELLDSQPAERLPFLRADHPDFGPLDALEWARFLRIHARHHELVLIRRSSG